MTGAVNTLNSIDTVDTLDTMNTVNTINTVNIRTRASSMIDVLPSEDIARVVSFGEVALVNTPYKPLTVEQVREGLEISRKLAKEGKVKNFDAALDEISEKYGL